MKIIRRFSNYVPTGKRTSGYGEANGHFCERATASHHDQPATVMQYLLYKQFHYD